MESFEIIIVGAGAVGSSIAYHLAALGHTNVALVDRGGVAGGPTGSSSAIIRQNYSNELTARLALESVRFFKEFAERTGDDCGYRATGCVSLAGVEEQAALATNVALQQRVGIDVRLVSLDDVRTLAPGISVEGVAAATYEPAAGYADPVLTAQGLVEAARAKGVRVRLQAAAQSVTVTDGRVTGVVTEAGPLGAERVILATGPWTNTLLGPVGASLPIRVTRHPVCVYERPDDFLGLHPVVGDFPNGVYLRAEGERLTLAGSLDIGPDDDVDPDAFATVSTFDEAATLGELAARRYPALGRANSRGGWAGVYDVTPDWHPVVDEIVEARGLYVAAGTSGHGFKLSPALGEHIARLLTGDALARTQLRPLRRSRFAEGSLMRSQYAHGIVA